MIKAHFSSPTVLTARSITQSRLPLNGTTFNFASTLDDTRHTLTLNGDISAAANVSLNMENTIGTSNNQRNGSGDVIINGDITLAGASAMLALGQVGTTPSAGVLVGKMTINGNILGTGGGNSVTVTNGNATVPTVVQLNGQNTHATMAVSAPGASSPTADANVGMGSSSIPDGFGGITSGPLGVGTVTVGGSAADGTTFEALGGARTVANPFDISTLQTILGVRGANDLTLSGAISGFGGLAKNGAGKLTLTGANTYLGGPAA